ncbi:hypothetical protein BDN72DRAFT_741733, partial [Pluteus cervinus]
LEGQLQKLRVQRNSLLPISTLPTEVLTEIFALCRIHEDYGWIEMQNLLPVTWVCHQWREVALSCATLWAHIEGSNLRWALPSIERSRGSSLVAEFS